jgi:hypothetical protein
MMGLCQEGKRSPDALRRSAGVIFLILRRVSLASQPRFLFEVEPDFHLLTQLFAAAQKIEFAQ